MAKPRRGELLELAVETLDEKGQGVGRGNDYSLHGRGAVPGEHVSSVIRKIRNGIKRIDARKDEITSSRLERIAPVCTHFGLCGGCLWQDVDYQEQIELKTQLL